MSKRVATVATWGRRLTTGPWHVMQGGWQHRTACGRRLQGEIETTRAPADGPTGNERGHVDRRVCRDCRAWANQPKGA